MKLIKTLLLAAALATSWLALAHTDKPHDKKAGPVKKEQKDWGIAGNAKAGMRTVEFRMTDNMRFTPDKIEVKQGETGTPRSGVGDAVKVAGVRVRVHKTSL